MKVIVDTDVWSEAFRKRSSVKSGYVDELALLIEEGRVELLGVIQMEILCGIRDERTFQRITGKLSAFPVQPIGADVFEMAARFFNLCRSKGIQGSNNDFVICAASVVWKCAILSKDKDFLHYQKYLPIELAEPR